MSEYMPYLPESGGGWKRKFEIIIPVILLIVILFIVAWKMGWLAFIPGFGGTTINAVIIGNDAQLVSTIETYLRPSMNINYDVLDANELKNIRDSAYFGKYSLLIMTEGVDGDTIPLESNTLDYLKDFAGSNKPILIVGRSGYLVSGSANERGWSKLGFVPVVCKEDSDCIKTASTWSSSWTPFTTAGNTTLYVRNTQHSMLTSFQPTLSFDAGIGSIGYVDINPVGGTSLIDMGTSTGTTVSAVVESGTGLVSSKVMYFAFHPSKQPALFKAAVDYITG